jgi:hypothetical protein
MWIPPVDEKQTTLFPGYCTTQPEASQLPSVSHLHP